MQAHWFFDFISPFAYLQYQRLEELRAHCDLRLVPILFAGLLKHWGHKGPAEIPGKRSFTYRQTLWLAHKKGIELQYPDGHPFNPLPLLRLCLACDNHPDVVDRIFRFVWRDGRTPEDHNAFADLISELGVTQQALNSPHVKQQLRDNTDSAIASDVFGVPTVLAEGHIFWGQDATDMVLDYVAGDPLFKSPEMARVTSIKVLASRTQ